MNDRLKNFATKSFNFNVQGVPWMLIFTMLLTVLKCMGKFNYSWWIVTAPLWGPITIVIGVILAVLVIALAVAALAASGVGIAAACSAMWRKWKQRRERIANERRAKQMEEIRRALQEAAK